MVKKTKIISVKAREILDSRGNPTIEVDLITEQGLFRAAVPSGVSTGSTEAVEIRDGGKRYGGKGVLKAARSINTTIGRALKGRDVGNQEKIDRLLIDLDGTKNKSRLGANAILAVSIAAARAGAKTVNLSLWRYLSRLAGTKPKIPKPGLLMIEGGLHSGGGTDFQEFIVIPAEKTFALMMERGVAIYRALQKIIKEKYGAAGLNVGYEGALTPATKGNEEAIALITEAIKKAGSGKEKLFIDAAATSFFRNKKYFFEGKKIGAGELENFYLKIVGKYPFLAIEDPFEENDFGGFKSLNEKIGNKITIVGDDLLTTDIKRIETAAEMNGCGGLILKPNQVGTVSETIAAAKKALSYNWQVFVKHRGGESNDDFIADLTVGLGTGWILSGAPCRGERLAKYNQILRIEEEFNKRK